MESHQRELNDYGCEPTETNRINSTTFTSELEPTNRAQTNRLQKKQQVEQFRK
ncbi:hypothetical protein SynSYN20_00607 [Synechococcus sp. SYN20]|nr:hypothetical protein SynSYN20_00607 [Synechococcus sp. SYN20]